MIPICDVLGCYSAKERLITIHHRNIDHLAATRLNCMPTDLEELVRLHEYAHALVHCGVASQDDRALLVATAGDPARWQSFEAERTDWFLPTRGEIGEFLAQAVTWQVISSYEEQQWSKVSELFIQLMKLQPPKYQLSSEELQSAALSWNCGGFFKLLRSMGTRLNDAESVRNTFSRVAKRGR